MNLKSFFIGATIGIVVGGTVFSAVKINKKDEELVTSQLKEEKQASYTHQSALEIVNYQKKYFKEYYSENYEVEVKNTSGKVLKSIEFTLGEGIYTLYDIQPDETYKFIAFNTENNVDLKVISINYEILTYNEDEISLEITNDGKKVTGKIKNTSQRDLYPSQVIFFLMDNEGNIIQKTLEYAGCFDEGLVIKPGKELSFEADIDENTSYYNSKKAIVRYSDLDFREVYTKFQ